MLAMGFLSRRSSRTLAAFFSASPALEPWPHVSRSTMCLAESWPCKVILRSGSRRLAVAEKATIESRSDVPRKEITRRIARFSMCNLEPPMLPLTSRTATKSIGAARRRH
uniref:Uncharacterized protein n=1 Tax=Kalanchoe fedtschenkoi TaxID=63787 RepID=A0A7N0UHH0_KALFE